jgi:peptidyl-prolyl cis-trans isomerase C
VLAASSSLRALARVALLVALASIAGDALAQERDAASPDAAADARRAAVVVTVGPRTMTVGELEDRIAALAPFQRDLFGKTPEEIRSRFLDDVVVPELVYAAGAEARGLDKNLATAHQLRRARSSATLRVIRRGIPSAEAIPMDEVRAYYDANRMHFDAPERINVWRILCKSKEDAATVIAEAEKALTTNKFNDLAREHSVDKATRYRGGNLGFLAPDGESNQAGLKVDVAIVRAAQGVKDGELVRAAVQEGDGWAVVWRRTTVPPSRRTVEEAAAQIRNTMHRQRTEAVEKKLIDELRARDVKMGDTSKMGLIVLPAFDAGTLIPRQVPSAKP